MSQDWDVRFPRHQHGGQRNHHHQLWDNEFSRHEQRRGPPLSPSDGEGILNFFDLSSANAASIHVDGTSSVNFNDGTTAGTAKIIAGDIGSTDDFTGGFIFFEGNSTADHATITAVGDSNIEFDGANHAGNAILTAGLPMRPVGADTNGFIFFTGTSSAENATITVNQFAELSFAPGFFGGGTATAGDANITNNGNTNFFQGSSAGNATITTNDGGLTKFFRQHRGQRAVHHQCGRRVRHVRPRHFS